MSRVINVKDRSGKMYNRDIDLAPDARFKMQGNVLEAGCVYAENYTTTGWAAAEAITITGLLTTDIPLVTLQDDWTSNVTLTTAKITANWTLTVTFSADPGSDTIISIGIMRLGS